jgi:ribosome maturation factor RimP
LYVTTNLDSLAEFTHKLEETGGCPFFYFFGIVKGPCKIFTGSRRCNKMTKRRSKNTRFSAEKAAKVAAQVEQLANPLCEEHGIELVHTVCRREPDHRIIRMYIDKPGGVKLDDCALISRELSDLLDIHLDIEDRYSLEVSSPGDRRPLGKAEDFERFKGSKIKIATKEAIDGRKNFTGVLMGLSEGVVNVTIDGRVFAIAARDIDRAHLVADDGENRCTSQT